MNAVRACPVGINPYAALKSVADALDLPRSYKTDLTVHDRAYCEKAGRTAPFLWALYDHGTHVIQLGPRMDAAHWVRIMAQNFTGLRWYLWDCITLFELVNERRAESIALDYEEAQS